MRSLASLIRRCISDAKAMSIIFAGIMAVTLIFAALTGTLRDKGWASAGGSTISWEEYEHGWPTVFLIREVINAPSNRFRLTQGNLRFDPWKLLFNTLTVILIVGLTFAYLKWHLKRHGTLWRFTTSEVLLVITMFGCGLGYFEYARARHLAELRICEQLNVGGHACTYKYRGPVFLARILGDWSYLSVFDRVDGVIFAEDSDNDDVKKVSELIRTLNCVTKVDASYMNSSDSALANVSSLPWVSNVRTLTLDHSQVTNDALLSLNRFRNLREISIAYTRLGDRAITVLSRLPKLEDLNCDGTAITESSLETLRQFPKLRKISAIDTAVPKFKLKEFSEATGCIVEY